MYVHVDELFCNSVNNAILFVGGCSFDNHFHEFVIANKLYACRSQINIMQRNFVS